VQEEPTPANSVPRSSYQSPSRASRTDLRALAQGDAETLKQIGLNALTTVLIVLIALGVYTAIVGTPTPSATTPSSGSNSSPSMSTPASGSRASVYPVPAHTTYNAAAPVAASGSTVDLSLTIKEADISIAPNVAYHAWTFNGTVPGPVLRVRQGQIVNFTLINNGTMGHSIDFHAAQVPPNVDYRLIPPKSSITFSFTPQYPGVFMYHCGAAPVMDHIANGMYGAIIVDPANGWTPAKEYVLIQSEFYTHQNADGSYSLDETKMMRQQPDYVVFNGYSAQYVSAPLTAQAGQKIRIFVVDAGPSGFSAFHVIGAIFSDYYPDGNPANHLVGDQTVTIPPGGGAVVELTIPAAGKYNFVTHSFAAAMSGAIGTIQVS
jgi:nitrite reductase (NO-forming)